MEQYVSIVSGSHTVELLLYCGDVALQCESTLMRFVQYPVLLNMLDCFAFQLKHSK